MCSRYFLDDDGNVIAYTFRVPVHEGIRRRFNIAPTHAAPVIRAAAGGEREVALLRWGLVPAWAKELSIGSKLINARSETLAEKPAFRAAAGGEREVALLRWGLVPAWAKELSIGSKLINARSETLAERPAFRAALRSRRCIVPASGFFEWTGEARYRVPHAITVSGRPLVPFAGLWESWKAPDGRTLETYTIVTTGANAFVSGMHDRMPAILEERDIDAWLGGTVEEAQAVLRPCADAGMREHMVSRALNSPNAEPEGLPPPSQEEVARAARAASATHAPASDPARQQSLFD
jgi:putative SOS response-associated peptidase YedK